VGDSSGISKTTSASRMGYSWMRPSPSRINTYKLLPFGGSRGNTPPTCPDNHPHGSLTVVMCMNINMNCAMYGLVEQSNCIHAVIFIII